MKTVVLVAPHFLPSFLPSVHRSRLWAYHLEEFGWKPVILTTDPGYYECNLDEDMLALLPPGLEIIRTRALPVTPLRLVGDIALRSLWWYRQALHALARSGRMDFLHFTIPASNAALLGPGVYRRFRVPYGLDYIDPWVPETDPHDRFLSKAWLAHRLARVLEPFAVRDARLITGINEAYFESVLRRNPHLRERAVTAGMPYGGSERDYEALERNPRDPYLFDPEDGNLHLIYAGALLPKAFAVLDSLLAAVSLLRGRNPDLARRLRIHFVGTGLHVNDPARGHVVEPYSRKHEVAGIVSELPSRIPYLDVLNHLARASAILVIGSTETHYSPSKIYQSAMSRRPVFTLLHAESTAVPVMRISNAGEVFTFSEKALPEPETLSQALERFLESVTGRPTDVNWAAFADVSARESARTLSQALDRALLLEARMVRP